MKKVFSFLFAIIMLVGCANKDKNTLSLDNAKLITYNNGVVKYYKKVYHKVYGNCSNDKDCAEITIEYPEFISNNVATDSVNIFVKNLILNLFFNSDKNNSLDEISDSLFKEYSDVQKEFSDYHIAWFIKQKVSISGIIGNILSLKSEKSIYTGGANTMYDVVLANFDISTGKYLKVADIVAVDDFSELESIAKTTFYKLKNIKSNKLLESAGYWFKNKRFELNNNFSVTDSGLVFFYNLYEIAPRASGTTELFIPKEKIDTLTDIYK